ncbi:hypothetical protein GCM10008921_18900 [Metaclostridioides mangenotii]
MLFSNYFMTIIYVFISLSSMFILFEIIKTTILNKRKNKKTKSVNSFEAKNNIIEINHKVIEINHEKDSRAITKLDSSKMNNSAKEIPNNKNNVLKYDNGDMYKGEVVNGKRSGFGICIFSENEKYEGLWKDDLMHGIGKYLYKDGIIYTGEFKRGKKNGLGKLIYPNGEIFKGYFLDDKRNGKGVVYTQEGKKEVGIWKNGEKIQNIEVDEFDKKRNKYKINNNNNNI